MARKPSTPKKKRKTAANQPAPVRKCGLIMPISAIDGCSESHWLEVRSILFDAIRQAGFEASLVSDADDIGVIQKRIVQNVYENPMIVCDVSGKNPNVMFELGMRLAFDKPTLIVKDDKTSYSFDTAPIEHVVYPRDLRFAAITQFKADLARRVEATYARATSDASYTTFLKHFGTFSIAKLDTKEITKEELLAEEIAALRRIVAELGSRIQSAGDPVETKGSLGLLRDEDPVQVFQDIERAVHRLVRRKRLTSFSRIVAERSRMERLVERHINAPRRFHSRDAFEKMFGAVFDAMVNLHVEARTPKIAK